MQVAGTPTWDTPVPVIDDGDDCCNAEHGATATALANRTAFLAQLLGIGVEQPICLNAIFNDQTRWGLPLSSEHLYWLQTDVTSGGGLWFPLALPVGAKLVSLTARLNGASFSGSSHSGLPASMPDLTLLRQTDGVDTSVGTQLDTSASVATYDATHSVVLTVNHVVLPGVHYHLRVRGESGANSSAGKLALINLTQQLAVP